MNGESQQPSALPTHYTKSTRVGVVIFALVLAVALSVLFFFGQRARHKRQDALRADMERSADAPVAADVVHVHTATTDSSLSLPGEARSFYETTIFARTSGYVSKWLVDIGDKVTEGQTLATIETPELDDQLVAANAKVGELQSEVHVAETAAKLAKVSYDRWNKLTPSGAVSVQDRDEKQAELESSDAKLAASKAQVALGDAEVQRLTTLTKFKTVKAPFKGVITQRHVDIGALVTAGSTSSTTPLFSISQADRIRVIVDVPQVAVPLMTVGMPVNATCREYPGVTFPGHLDRTASSIDLTTKTLRVEVLVPNKDLKLLPGMYLQVNFQSTREHPPLMVQAGALCFRAGGPQLAVVAHDGRIEMRDVKITRDLGEDVEIEGAGIEASATVALNVGNDVTTGDHVEVNDLDPPATQPTRTAAATTR
jgi:RND family efflux transporter MFP subunit